jgi:hypothetical protein
MRWHFSTKRPSDKTRDPVVGEFFSSDAIKDAGEALVREGIQNSLDARLDKDSGFVSVRIYLSGEAKALLPQQHSRWFDSAWDHFEAPRNGLRPGDVSRHKACRFLVFEDFGTTGLTGDREQYEEQEGSSNPFFYFFRAEAKTAKYGDDRGRWGIGKQVFPRSSQAQTFFGYTETDEGGFLMGGCVLKHHTVDGTCFKPDGFWGESKYLEDDILTVPVAESEALASFRRDFQLHRAPGQRGLSVVVPWLDDADEDGRSTRAFDRNSLLLAVLEGYFLPILEGRLEVTVEDDAGALKISKSTYRETLQLLKLAADPSRTKEIERLEAFLRLAEKAKGQHFLSFDLPPCAESKAGWTDSMLSDSMASEMREALAQGRAIRVAASLTVRPKGDSPSSDKFYCFIEKTPEIVGRPCHIREDLIIAGVESSKVSGFTCLVRIDRGPLATLLGDSESPAHTEWQPSSRNFKDKYVYGGVTISFVSQFPSELLRRIHSTSRQLDRKLLVDLFSDKGPEPNPDDPGKRKRPQTDGDDPDLPLPIPSRAPFRISETATGFLLASAGGFVAMGSEIRIKAAYETSKGNPFHAYRVHDFEFSDGALELVPQGCRIVLREGNQIRLVIEEEKFSLRVLGFDVNRDVVVRADLERALESPDAEAPAEAAAGA